MRCTRTFRSGTLSKDYLDRLLASMSEALLITDADGKIERANAAAVELLDIANMSSSASQRTN